jgi:hypothetical protein
MLRRDLRNVGRRGMSKRIAAFSILIGLSVALVPTAPASATPPDRFHSADSGSEPGFVQCEGFEIDLETTGTTDGIVFFNGSGEVIKVIVRTRATDVFTNSATGKTLVNRGVFQQVFTRIDGTDEFTHSLVGFRFMGTLPGLGVVLQDVGRIEYSPDEEEILFISGQHFDVPGGSDAGTLLCAALS